ncbi:efflux transporter, RND family, MFP subunit [Prosthecochloris aestuarii DSM 271]|uniref:Efflux transporter, RND family, MFP subunit n=1 Tax=Prosthecochloris aestuarii (strain DSM 271 / SK 413) TaxID=290512 RepID=B4S8N4_PROA2|nr:efflux RND transporter periplasmic adaptor subunit [Prosthecochloris aestuarii]ACF46421.1 efflux transporter, RND family, MFP subunit [Prosthecochloris aestuarii DSM 271]
MTNIRKRLSSFCLGSTILLLSLSGCEGQNARQAANQQQPPSLPVMNVMRSSVSVNQEYAALIEGVTTVEIRPQVEGVLKEIAVDEGAYVNKGDLLFTIDDRIYRQELQTAVAAKKSAEAALAIAALDVEKLKPLVRNNVVSEVQLQEARAHLRAAKAALDQAAAKEQIARINLEYSSITAPVNGYIGAIAFRTGSLVSRNQSDKLTTLSDVHQVRAYFSMSEVDFVRFRQRYPGGSIEEPLSAVPPVHLLLADGTTFGNEGRLDAINGQFDRTTASVTLRATFPNPDGLLRSGNTGKVVIGYTYDDIILVPQSATSDLQDRIFVSKVNEGNAVARTPVTVIGRSGNDYIVSGGLEDGDMIILSGFSRLPDGTVISPLQKAGEESALPEEELKINEKEGV